jgi:hypothetical protein
MGHFGIDFELEEKDGLISSSVMTPINGLLHRDQIRSKTIIYGNI